ncbi:glycoside hydrolase family 3 N-terminal domain-containing protein [Flavobacterium gilvum]|uniref:glycoside hydrolase family 3 N-terminal domain-containing protein n=1 Tax=Flavobacterium gilvum TaxID=1492737 RepID=UPI0004E321C7|nr:glycoside hydrolase family 3 N-terminal domain-containing protein [Flavobacterium gilvum]KFC58790.1 beta-glucosidase [Flavobacterium gilvum]
MKFLLPTTVSAVIVSLLFNGAIIAQTKSDGKILPYKNPALPVEKRVNDLLARMTLEEKVYQMCALRLGDGDEIFKSSGVYSIDYIRQQMKSHGTGHISCPTTDMDAAKGVKTVNEIQKVAVEETRLGIPTLINDEALHGVKGFGATTYPQSIALSCTWDLPLMKKITDAIGKEAYSRGIRQALSPVLDLARDPRHGRMEETYGEDPYLASRFAVEFIKNVQQNGVICTPKHFAANFVPSNGLDAANVSLSERELREIHLVPYKAAVTEAHAKSLMAAYNAIDGVPCHANKWLLTDILRKEWGFTGYTVSDWSGVVHTMGMHKIAESKGEAAVICAKAGLDVDLPRYKAYVELVDEVKKGNIDQSVIDESVKRILRVKFEMGLFEHPYIEDTTQATKLCNAPEFRALAKKAAEESIVLLKNKNNVLPIAATAKSIAVIGPNANVAQLGGYSSAGVPSVSPVDGIKNIFGSTATIRYAKGCTLTGKDTTGFEEAVNIAKQSDIIVLVMGGQYSVTGGESQDRIDLNLMGVQEELIKTISSLGKPVIVVLDDSRPVTMLNWIDKVDAVLQMFPAGEEGGNALAEILAGKVNPSGKTTVTIPRHTGQIPLTQITRPYGREGSVAEYPETKVNGIVSKDRYYCLYPFGFGLSYTTFQYGAIKFAKDKFSTDEKIELSVNITNTGSRDGDEIVQLYFTNLHTKHVTQAPRQLRAFQRVSIPAGGTQTVTFTLNSSDLSYLDENLKPKVDAGDFEIFVGGNSVDGVTNKFTLVQKK